MSELPTVPAVTVPAVAVPAVVLAAVVDGGADDIELVAALSAVAAVTGTGEVGRRLGGRIPAPSAVVAADPWTVRARSAAAPGTASGAPRRTHRWARSTSHRT